MHACIQLYVNVSTYTYIHICIMNIVYIYVRVRQHKEKYSALYHYAKLPTQRPPKHSQIDIIIM